MRTQNDTIRNAVRYGRARRAINTRNSATSPGGNAGFATNSPGPLSSFARMTGYPGAEESDVVGSDCNCPSDRRQGGGEAAS